MGRGRVRCVGALRLYQARSQAPGPTAQRLHDSPSCYDVFTVPSRTMSLRTLTLRSLTLRTLRPHIPHPNSHHSAPRAYTMATFYSAFSSPLYSTSSYSLSRPTYPPTLYTHHLLPYHSGPRNLLLDIGCGPGTVTRPLSASFTHVYGIDPSASMIETARSLTPTSQYPSITYHESPAEHLPFVKDAEADMVVAAQAVHWFDQANWWREMERVVRKGGTVAVWGYKDCMLPTMPRATQVLKHYSHHILGPFWAQPQRGIVEGRLRAISPPEEGWEDVVRWEHEAGYEVPVDEEVEKATLVPVEEGGVRGRWVKTEQGLLRNTWTLGQVEEYIRTWSSVFGWKKEHPDRRSRKEGGDGDVVDEMMEEMRKVEGLGEGWREVESVIAWGHGVVMARRREK